MSHTSSRRFDLDWLRMAAFALLILYHAGMAFVSWDWHIKLARLVWLEPVMQVTNAWRLLLLFLISGIASAAMLGKTGIGGRAGFLASRSKRLLLPLLLGIVLVVPPQAWVEVQVKGSWAGSYLLFWRTRYFGFSDDLGLILPTWNHLWFVTYLWAYTLLLALLPASWLAAWRRGVERGLAGNRLLWLPMLAIAGIRLALADRFPESHDLVSDWCMHWIYGGGFFIGAAMGTAGPLWTGVARLWRAGLLLGLAGWAVVASINGLPGEVDGGWLIISRMARAVQAWGMIIGLLGLAQRFLAVDHRWRQPLAEAVFPAYLIHQTIIVLAAWWLLPLALPLWAKAAVLMVGTAVGTTLFCMATARIGWLRPWVGYSSVPRAKLSAA
ncbi:acyltransferase family protein [Sandarakinorhabdus rubra]|uniref:acyltransferase family protein n=1 Tax=Sandarakinorhabdus rubra TaxID=2672568 RepID=UPI0013DD157E|nr:acyltransferase family protein [Sandarakinorhabdus rubra]